MPWDGKKELVRYLDPFGDACCSVPGSLRPHPRAEPRHDGKHRLFLCSVCGRTWRVGVDGRKFTLTDEGDRLAMEATSAYQGR